MPTPSVSMRCDARFYASDGRHHRLTPTCSYWMRRAKIACDEWVNYHVRCLFLYGEFVM
jgi:hypothetical protein